MDLLSLPVIGILMSGGASAPDVVIRSRSRSEVKMDDLHHELIHAIHDADHAIDRAKAIMDRIIKERDNADNPGKHTDHSGSPQRAPGGSTSR